MKKKGTLWMADWRDAGGKRHRKGFPTRAKAEKHAAAMRGREAAKKGQARSPKQGKSSKRTRRTTTASTAARASRGK